MANQRVKFFEDVPAWAKKRGIKSIKEWKRIEELKELFGFNTPTEKIKSWLEEESMINEVEYNPRWNFLLSVFDYWRELNR